jgi:5-methylcytosine-specific restriction endonuclease McrBC regulatory subunit McrC
MKIQLKDNTPNQPVQGVFIEDLQSIANKKIDSPNDGYVLVYPSSRNESNVAGNSIFTLEEQDGSLSITTGNVMGFVGTGKTEIAISSRFAEDDGKDYFLHYMLQRTNGLNIVNLDTSKGADSILDFLLYLFPSYLSRAMRQGLYKEYKRNHYNNANIKGAIDIPRHIRLNVPFQGKIAYTTREYSHDNPVLQLIRHTIEYIKAHKSGKHILSRDEETMDNANKIIFNTQSYNKSNRQKVIDLNRRPVTHPYLTEYRSLQRLCLQILRHGKLSFGKNAEKIHGILFNGALLWEEYIATVFKRNNLSIQHKTSRDKLFTNGRQCIIPDFITYTEKPFTASFIGDTKYKLVGTSGNEASHEDYYQVITYMYRYSCKTGYILFPLKESNEVYIKGKERTINNKGRDSKLIELGLDIPQKAIDFNDFCEKMKKAEGRFVEVING